jgi:FecR protein
MTLSKFIYAPQQQTHEGIINMARGILRAVTRKLLPQTTIEVRTATAVAAVRGTQWLGEVTPEATAITVIEGELLSSMLRRGSAVQSC